MKIILTLLILILVVFAGSVQADLSNARPVGFGNSWDGKSLQNVLDGITTQGHIDTVNDQISAAIFTDKGDNNNYAVASFIVEIAGNASQNTFGIYDYFNPNNKARIFTGTDTQGAVKMITFMANGDVLINGLKESTFNPANLFGFYLQAPGGTFYSEDSLNGGKAQAIILQGDGSASIQLPDQDPHVFTSSDFIIAFEDLSLNRSTDRDYQDLVVEVSSILPAVPAVPAPGALFLGGLGLGLVGWVKKRYA